MSDVSSTPGVRPEIELSWRRAQMFGLDPGMEVQGSVLSGIDRRSRLIVAAEPVLDRMAQDLADTRFSVLLADSASVIVDRRYGQRSLTGALDRVMAVPGSHYTEAVSGTNALATAYELRQPISVTGAEHYLEALQQFSCFGAPIVHPATRRLEGVLDITGHADDATELLPPFLMRAVRDIEQHLLNGARTAEQRMLAAFQSQAAHRPNPVVVLSDDVLLANRPAVDLLHAGDHAKLRELAIDAPRSGTVSAVLTLDSGTIVAVHYARVPDSPGGVIFDFEPGGRRQPVPRRTRRSRPAGDVTASGSGPVLIYGEPGTGRSFLARRVAGEGAQVLPAHDELTAGTSAWILRARQFLETGQPVVVDDVHLLSPVAAGLLAKLVDACTGSRLVMVAGEVSGQAPEYAALLARCTVRRGLAPLRLREEPLADIVRELMQDIPAARGRRLTPTALHILDAYNWPGNVRELRAVLAAAAAARRSGDITERDLPPAYRISPRRRHLGLLEQAEHDMIVAVLAEEGGNKAHAAARLGIGRTTLYERIRRYGIPT
jgi:transcriptional regulator of acetoin/glycerol metabolism